MTDLVERIESTRFVGNELVIWLWFKSELFEGEFSRPNGDPMQVWLDSQLLLRAASDPTEKVQFSGVAPSASLEAKLALRGNKIPQRARVCIRSDPKEFSFVFDAETFAFGTVKLPALLTEDGDEQFLERMDLLNELFELFNEVYSEFLTLRTSALWDKEFVPAVLAWAKGEPQMSTQAYRGLLKRAAK